MTTHRTTEPLTVTHARAHWWTLDLANAFVSPGVNSRGGLVPSHGASRRRLGDQWIRLTFVTYTFHKFVRHNHFSDIYIQVVSLDPRSSFHHSGIHHIRTEKNKYLQREWLA
jgi:hypothetical protein